MLFNIVVGLIMAVSFVGMILCAKKQHMNSLAKPAAIGLLVVVVICAIMILSKNMGGEDTEEILANEMVYVKASTYILGQDLAKKFPGSKVLMIVAKVDENNIRQKALISGLKEGCGAKITDITVDAPKVTPPKGSSEMYDGMLDISELMTAKDFNKLISKHRTCDIIITTIGLPQDAGNLKLWKLYEKNPKKCPKLVLVGGDVSRMAPFLQVGLVPDVVVYSPDAEYIDGPAPTDLKKAFDMRYLLINKANLEQIMKKYPKRIFSK